MSRMSDLKKSGEPLESCFSCQEEADAMWMGAHELFICRECAERILPALLADAISQSNFDPADALQRAEARYWFACYHNAQTDRKTLEMKLRGGRDGG